MERRHILQWLEDWFLSRCNGDWEHSEGIRIETLDNPGWHVRISLEGTHLQEMEYSSGLIERDKNDWYAIKIKDGIYEADGDPKKLDFLLQKFMDLNLQTRK